MSRREPSLSQQQILLLSQFLILLMFLLKSSKKYFWQELHHPRGDLSNEHVVQLRSTAWCGCLRNRGARPSLCLETRQLFAVPRNDTFDPGNL